MISTLRLILVAVAAAALASPAAAQVEPLTNEKIIRNFNIVAFGNEYTHKRYDKVRKWESPIRIGIQGKGYPPYFEEFVNQQIDDLGRLTGHPIRLYYSFALQKAKKLAKDFNPKKVNVILFYLPTEKIPAAIAKYFDNDVAAVKKMIKVSTCFAKFGTRKNEIRWAIVVFPSHHSKEYIRACVVEELTQILGLANDSARVNPSIFNDRSQHFELTEHDRWMIRMFYDTRIPWGMPRPDALRWGKKILEEIRPGK